MEKSFQLLGALVLIITTSVSTRPVFSQTLDVPYDQFAKLQDRYRQKVISLNSAQLSGFRYHLRSPDRRRLLDAEGEPIPTGCRLLERFLDKMFLNLQPGLGVSFFQIDLVTSRAYIKMDSDISGSLQELEWTQREVQSVAALIDALLRGLDKLRDLTQQVTGGASGLASSWTEFSAYAKGPYVVPSEWVKYLYTIRIEFVTDGFGQGQ
jgi:hypothetical protein